MKKAWALIKLYLNSLFGIGAFINDIKKNRKEAAKKIGLIGLIAFSLIGIVPLMVMFNINLFDTLKPMNQQGVVITNSIISSIIMTLIFGLTGVIATYFMDKEADLLFSMPLKPWNILISKFVVNYVYELIVSFIIMGCGFIVYGIRSGSSVLFYVASVLVTLLVPIIPIVICYFIIIPIMKFANIKKKKDTMMIISGCIVFFIAIGFQVVNQKIVNFQNNRQALIQAFASQNSYVKVAGKIYYPSIWGTYAITNEGTISGILYFLIFTAVSILALAVLLKVMSNTYMKSIIGSTEISSNLKKYSNDEFKQKIKSKSKFKALLDREIKLMNREPVFLLNGPLVIILMPLIFGVIFYIQKDTASQLSKLTTMKNAEYYITLITAAMGVFLGASANITSTSISREGKTLMFIKSLPINAKDYINAKLMHGIIIGLIADIMSCVIVYVILHISILSSIIAIIISITALMPILISGLLIELQSPKLDWDNPTKAMKQNVNAVFPVFGSMIWIGVFAFIIFNFNLATLLSYVIIFLISLIISLLMYYVLMNYCEKRINSIEI